MSRVLIGHERTRALRAMAALAMRYPDAWQLARMLGMKRHSIVPLLNGQRLPGRAFLEASARLSLTWRQA